MSTPYTEWRESVLIPAIYGNVPTVFRWLTWESKTNKWVSKQHLDGRTDGDGTDGKRRHRAQFTTNITAAHPYAIKDYAAPAARNVIKFYAEHEGIAYTDAVRTLARVCGVSYAFDDDHEWQREEEINIARQQAHEVFQTALFDDSIPAAVATREYLHRRAWSDDVIHAAEVGVITRDIVATLPEVIRDEFSDTRLGGDDGQYYLVIALHSGSRYYGFKVRALADGVDPKYLNTKGTEKGDNLFALPTRADGIILCDGELDALHAKALGMDNVVSTTGGAASVAQLQQAVRRGVRKITIIPDNDEAGRTHKQSTIDHVAVLCEDPATAIDIYVATLPETDDDGRKVKDIDDYLRTHTVDDLQALVDNAPPLCYIQVAAIVARYSDKPFLADRTHDDFFREVGDVLYAPTTPPRDRESIYAQLEAQQKRLQINVDDLREDARRRHDTAAAAKTAQGARRLVGAINNALAANDTAAITKAVREAARTLATPVDRDRLATTFAIPTPPQQKTALGVLPVGIPTAFLFEDRTQGYYEPLTLNVGLTFVCGCRGHGKTSFLNCLALDSARRNVALNNGESVLYFSYEVPRERILVDMLTAYVDDEEISDRPAESILSYYAGEGTEFMYGHLADDEERRQQALARFNARADEFLYQYTGDGVLQIIDEPYKVEELLTAIDYYVATARRHVTTIYIDYAQLLYSEDYARARTEEIKRIVNDIKNYANKHGIAFVLAAQFNREVQTPASVDTKNIGEGGDFERIADTVVGIYNLAKLPKRVTGAGATEEAATTKRILRDLHLAPDDPNYDDAADNTLAPIAGKMFARLLKRRNGNYPIDAAFEWRGSIKSVVGNAPANLLLPARRVAVRAARRKQETPRKQETRPTVADRPYEQETGF